MNVENIIDLHKHVANFPDGVTRLRRFVLDLAVRGRLVKQDSAEEPISNFLASVTHKGRFSKMVSNPKFEPETVTEIYPYKLPLTWRWVRFGEIVEFSAGKTPPRNEPTFWNTGDYPWICIGDIPDGQTILKTKETVSNEARAKIFKSNPSEPGTMIFSFKLTIGKIARLGVSAYFNEAIIAIRPVIDDIDPYLFMFLPLFARSGKTINAVKGATLNRTSIANILIPLPPLAEQRRIVAKVDELMGLCGRLEAVQAILEKNRNDLTKSTLDRLSVSDSDDVPFRSSAIFAIKVFPSLTNRVDQINQLRQSVLDLAVRGRLVKQDSAEEPISNFLASVTHKGRFSKMVSNPKFEPETVTEIYPYKLPLTWRWVRFGEIVEFSAGKTPPRNEPTFWNTGDYPWICIGDIPDGQTILKTKETVSNEARAKIFKSNPSEPGTMIFSFKLTIGKIARLGVSAYFNEAIIAIRPVIDDIDPYLFMFLPLFARSGKTINAVKGATLNRTSIANILIPLPPLAEQRRIVAKVDELMVLCDQLEVNLNAVNNSRQNYLESFIQDALQNC